MRSTILGLRRPGAGPDSPFGRQWTRLLIVFAAGIAPVSADLEAQVSGAAETGLFSAYVWRGVTLSSRPVLQPAAALLAGAGPGTVAAGVWANVELGRYDPPDIGEGGGRTSPDLTEINLWAEYRHTTGQLTLAAGVIHYLYPNDAGFTSDQNTLELAARVEAAGPGNPRISAFMDVDEVRGLYLEGALSTPLTVAPGIVVRLGALAGASVGQGSNGGQNYGNFAGEGFTHADLSAAIAFQRGSFSVAPVLHLTITGDDATEVSRLTTPPDRDRIKPWIGMVVGTTW